MHWLNSTHVVAAAESVSALLAGGALVVSARLLRREAKRDRAKEAAGTRDQANRVSAYMRLERQTLGGPGTPAVGQVLGYVLNASTLPVYDVCVTFAVEDPDPDGDGFKRVIVSVGFVPPGPEVGFDSTDLQGRTNNAQALPLTFRDSAGRNWLRDGSGKLYPLTEELLDRYVTWWPDGLVELPEPRRWQLRKKRALKRLLAGD